MKGIDFRHLSVPLRPPDDESDPEFESEDDFDPEFESDFNLD